MANIYVNFGNGSSTGYYAVPVWTALTAYVSTANGGRGDYIRQATAPTVGNERVFRCTTSGTSLASEPGFALTKNATTTEAAGPVWTECTGQELDQGPVAGVWTAPHARLANAFVATWGAAGDSFFVASNHAETRATAMTLTSPGTPPATPCYVYCVTQTTVPPVSANLTTGAAISTTGASNIVFGGSQNTDFSGCSFVSGDAANTASITMNGNSTVLCFRNCALTLGNTSGSSIFYIGASNVNSEFLFVNSIFTFGSVAGQFINGAHFGRVRFISGSIAGGAIKPTSVFASARASELLLRGVDLSDFGSGVTLMGAGNGAGVTVLQDCAFGASVTVAATPSNRAHRVYVVRSDSAGTNYRHEQYTYLGTQTVETTIVRTGGASDGTTPIAWKIVTTANSKWIAPYECLPIGIWNDTTAADVTVTLYGIWGGGAVPNNDDIWMEVGYLGSAATPIQSLVTASKADNLAAGAALTTDASAWGGSTTKFKISCTLSGPQPAQKGTMYIYVKAAKTSSTFYIDPLAVLS